MKVIDTRERNLIEEIQQFINVISPTNDEIDSIRAIISDVKTNGDEALARYTRKFDNVEISPADLKVNQSDIDAAYSKAPGELIKAIQRAKRNIETFQNHIKIKPPDTLYIDKTSTINTVYRPIEKIGAYIPGGSASYPSTVLMNVVPAKVAGVEHIVMVSPPGKDGNIPPERLVAASEAGVDEIYKVGGAHSIAALAFGTDSIPAVDKIVGPGNVYVAIAKKELYGNVGIDIIAGPSEVLIIADHTADPRFVAADMASQAEHDPGVAVLATTSEELAKSVQIEIDKIIADSSRAEGIKRSLDRFGLIIIVQNEEELCLAANKFAAEHLEIQVENPEQFAAKVKNAGAVFVGNYTPVALGDYIAGPSHVLPTGGTARFFSGLSVNDFLKRTAVIKYTKDTLKDAADDTIELATSEGLIEHAGSIKVRLD